MPQSSTELLVLDLETTMNCKRDGHSSATVHDDANKILCGCMIETENGCLFERDADFSDESSRNRWLVNLLDSARYKKPVLVGHNIKFDLAYLLKTYPNLADGAVLDCPVWDTQIAEYILSGQLVLFPSLAYCVDKRVPGGKKDDIIDRYLQDGKTTSDIPIVDLLTYCMNDCRLTLDVALSQMTEARKRNPMLVDLIMLHSSVSKVLAEMEHRGMKYDPSRAIVEMSIINDDILDIKRRIAGFMEALLKLQVPDAVLCAHIAENTIDDYIGSNKLWGCVFFGGEYTFKYKEDGVPYKSGPNKGKPRVTSKEQTVAFPQAHLPPVYGAERTKTGAWSVDDNVLFKLSECDKLAELLRKFRKLNKLMTTYFTSLPNHLFNGCLHPTVNQTATTTGRFSQSKPNLQNVANEARVKNCFVTHSQDLVFIEADYKQLEMNIFAHIYQDPTLLADVRAGIDIHAMIGRELYGAKYTDDLRRKVKGVVFGTIYGGGAATLSQQVRLPEDTVRKVIAAFNKRYPGIRKKRDKFMGDALFAASLIGSGSDIVKHGENIYWMMSSPTGRTYPIMMNRKVVSSGITWDPSYTNLCNYPIQGLATGDIVPMMLYHVWQNIRKGERPITIVNTVHDSILFEVPEVDVYNQMEWIKEQLESAPKVFEHWFGTGLDVNLPVSVKYSKGTWAGPWIEWTPF